ncbi:MAG TPA: leucine-rich repeat protein [Gammaproteobacteria bacterium]|nr:leucine-rich repeat protein [Gammaproteobacteria bacterium]
MKKRFVLSFVTFLIITMCCFAVNPEKDFNYKLADDGESIIITGFKNNLNLYDIPSEIEEIPVTAVDIEFLGFPDIPEILIKLPDGLKQFTLVQTYSRNAPLSHITVDVLPATLEKCKIRTQKNKKNPEVFYISLKGSIKKLTQVLEFQTDCVDFEEKSITVRKEWQNVKYRPIKAMYSFDSSNIEEVIFEEGLQIVTGFSNCLKLKRVTLPSTIKVFGTDAFKFCSMLSEVTVPESVEAEKSYGSQAFYGTSLPLKTQVKLRKIGYPGSFGDE